MKRLILLARMGALAAIAAAIPACYDYPIYNGPYNVAWFVDPTNGDDLNGDGSPQFPFRTINHAIQMTIFGDEIVLAPGTYSAPANTEVFPLIVPPGILVMGDPASLGTTTIISGGGAYTPQGGTQVLNPVSATLVLGEGAQVTGVQVTSAGANGVGIVCDGTSPAITSSTITGCTISGIRTFQGASPTITSVTITTNTADGVTTFDTSSPSLRTCFILTNGANGLSAQDTSAPNLGDASGVGANTLTGNASVGLENATTASTIQAVGNTWIASTEGSDPSGHYAAALQAGPVAVTLLNNYAITAALAAIQF